MTHNDGTLLPEKDLHPHPPLLLLPPIHFINSPKPFPHSQTTTMSSTPKKSSYHRLKHETWFDEDDGYLDDLREKVIGKSLRRRSRRVPSYKFHLKRKLRVKIPSLKRFLISKTRLVRVAWGKVCRRLKESQSHFGDLFAGNYLFMQVTPTALKYANDHGSKPNLVNGRDNVLSFSNNNSARFSLPRIAS